MVAIVTELFDKRTETLSARPTAEVQYLVSGAIDEAEVKTEAQNAIPLIYSGLLRKVIVLEERLDASSWRVTAHYGIPEVDDAGQTPDPVETFDTGGGQQHITQSLSTISRHGPAASVELKGAIGFDGEQVQGVDITVPVYNFTETQYFEDAEVTFAYRGIIMRLTGRVNDAPFKGFQAGEVLFLGASGSRRVSELWEITFRFAGLPNRTSFQVGDILVPAKKGWEYLWVQYGKDVDIAVKQIIKKPIAVYIEKVYELGDFSTLDIGV